MDNFREKMAQATIVALHDRCLCLGQRLKKTRFGLICVEYSFSQICESIYHYFLNC